MSERKHAGGISRAGLGLRPWARLHALGALGAAVALAGCHEHEVVVRPCGGAHAPVGLYSITGDNEVTVYWIPVAPEEVETYVVYRSTSPDQNFREIGQSDRDYFVDDDVVNGSTYYYAVSAVDACGNETELSQETVFDTPRPEGFGARIYDANGVDWPRSGWEFDPARVVPWDHPDADMYFVLADDTAYLVAADLQTDIQDAGYGEFDDVDWAPSAGWSPTGTVEVIPGHLYVVWTGDNHYAKVRVRTLFDDSVVFDWAYQVDEGNPELAPRPPREPSPLSVRPRKN